MPVTEDHPPPGSHNVRFGTAPDSRLGHQVADHNGGSAGVIRQPPITQRYEKKRGLAGDTPKRHRVDIVFVCSNISEGN
jgi:hypothetical protein